MVLSEVIRDNGIRCISIRKQGATLITCQQHPGLVPSITMLSAYRYIRILCFFIVLHDEVYAIVLILIGKIAYITSLQGSYMLIFCPYLAL